MRPSQKIMPQYLKVIMFIIKQLVTHTRYIMSKIHSIMPGSWFLDIIRTPNYSPLKITLRAPLCTPLPLGRDPKPRLHMLGRLCLIALDPSKVEQPIAVDQRKHTTTQTRECRMLMMAAPLFLHKGMADPICEPPTGHPSLTVSENYKLTLCSIMILPALTRAPTHAAKCTLLG
jgi:hypothetical protein